MDERSRSGNDEILNEIVDASPIGMALEDLDGRPIRVNKALCSMLGYSEEEMTARHCVDFSDPLDAKRDWALFEQLKNGSIRHYQMEKRFRRRDNSILWGRLSVCLLRGRPLVIAAVEDISNRRSAHDLLRSMADLELVTKQMAAAVIHCNRDFRYIWANNRYAEWIQRPIDAIVGLAIADVVGKEAFESLQPSFERALAGEKVTYERQLDIKGIGPRWISGTCTPTFDGWVAVENDVTERKKTEEALSGVSQKLIAAQEEERKWIARELHDDVNQRLALLAVNLDRIGQQLPESASELGNEILEASRMATEIGDDVQALSHRLHSSKLEYLGLEWAARSFCTEFGRRQKIEIRFHSQNILRHLPSELSLALFRVLQEALRNAAKHSGSTCVEVSLLGGQKEVELSVRDFGRGFQPEEGLRSAGIGIVGMRERLKLVGGMLKITSDTGTGTRVQAYIPVPVAT